MVAYRGGSPCELPRDHVRRNVRDDTTLRSAGLARCVGQRDVEIRSLTGKKRKSEHALEMPRSTHERRFAAVNYGGTKGPFDYLVGTRWISSAASRMFQARNTPGLSIVGGGSPRAPPRITAKTGEALRDAAIASGGSQNSAA